MTRYTNADFTDDDSVNSVQFTEGKFGKCLDINLIQAYPQWRVLSLRSREFFPPAHQFTSIVEIVLIL